MNILTFDIEEWFHILDSDAVGQQQEWNNYEVRIHANIERIYSILEKTGSRATFFCLGWIAKKYPEVIKMIDAKGYEIGSHGHGHQLIYQQSKKEFQNDLEFSIRTLEDLIGKKVKYYRAPGFSITKENKWAFEVIASAGIEVDCSVFPAPRAHGGLPAYKKQVPSVLVYQGIELKELPINYAKLAGKPLIFSGGGYFRLLPYSLLRYWSNKSEYIMSYLHPRDFDTDQPMITGLPFHRKFKSYVGLKNAEKKLVRWLEDFEFVDIRTAIDQVDWDKAERVLI